MVDSIGPRQIVPIPRIRRPADDENRDESKQRDGRGRGKYSGERAPDEDEPGTRKGSLIDDQA